MKAKKVQDYGESTRILDNIEELQGLRKRVQRYRSGRKTQPYVEPSSAGNPDDPYASEQGIEYLPDSTGLVRVLRQRAEQYVQPDLIRDNHTRKAITGAIVAAILDLRSGKSPITQGMPEPDGVFTAEDIYDTIRETGGNKRTLILNYFELDTVEVILDAYANTPHEMAGWKILLRVQGGEKYYGLYRSRETVKELLKGDQTYPYYGMWRVPILMDHPVGDRDIPEQREPLQRSSRSQIFSPVVSKGNPRETLPWYHPSQNKRLKEFYGEDIPVSDQSWRSK